MKTGSREQFIRILPDILLALTAACLGSQIRPGSPLGGILVLFGPLYLAVSAVLRLAGFAQYPPRETRSMWLALPGFMAVFFLAPLEYLYLGGALRASLLAQAAGLAVILSGLALRAWARAAVQGQTWRCCGPFRFIRHPDEAGCLLVGLGLALGLGSHIGLATAFFLLLPGLFCQMCTEEELLTRQLGDEYLQYAVKTKRLIPGVW